MDVIKMTNQRPNNPFPILSFLPQLTALFLCQKWISSSHFESSLQASANLRSKGLSIFEGCSGCGEVGKAVASATRGLRFESSHW